MSVDDLVTVRGVSSDAGGNVTPRGSRKDAPGIRRRIPRDSRSPLGIEMQRVETKLTCLPTE